MRTNKWSLASSIKFWSIKKIMANETKLNLKSTGTGRDDHLSRSWAVFRGSVLTSLNKKGGVGRVGSPQQAGESSLVENKDPKDLDPTRYGDWEHKGRCVDF